MDGELCIFQSLRNELTLVLNSPATQTAVLGTVLLLTVGLNNAVLGLGAGGNRPDRIPTVDRVNYVLAFTIVGASCVGGIATNKLGPRYTVVLAAVGYPLYIGCLWYVGS